MVALWFEFLLCLFFTTAISCLSEISDFRKIEKEMAVKKDPSGVSDATYPNSEQWIRPNKRTYIGRNDLVAAPENGSLNNQHWYFIF